MALASGAILLTGGLCQTGRAQEILNSSATLPGAASVSIPVAYQVFDNSGVYTYDYEVSNPAGDSAAVLSFSVGFNSTTPGALVAGGNGANNSGLGVIWNPTIVLAGDTSSTLSFLSDEAPIMGNASVNGTLNPPGPWGSTSDPSTEVPVPSPVPEPEVTSLLSLAMLLLPFQPIMIRKIRRL
jgi:hypothetical protein